MGKDEFQFMVEGMVSDLIQLLMERRGLSMTEAFDTVYRSRTYENILNPDTRLYFQSPGYVYSYLAVTITEQQRLVPEGASLCYEYNRG